MPEHSFVFENGDKVKDKITGFSGIIIARTHWFTGCNHYLVEATKLQKDGERTESHFDESRLLVIKKAAIDLGKTTRDPPSGPVPKPRDPYRSIR